VARKPAGSNHHEQPVLNKARSRLSSLAAATHAMRVGAARPACPPLSRSASQSASLQLLTSGNYFKFDQTLIQNIHNTEVKTWLNVVSRIILHSLSPINRIERAGGLRMRMLTTCKSG
jgi:hypothetical protein